MLWWAEVERLLANHTAFLTNKGRNQQSEINLCENNVIISDQKQVSDIFNDFFVNVAKDIGTDSDTHNEVLEQHQSIKATKENIPFRESNFKFSPVSENDVDKYLKQIGDKKATGIDNISAKMLKSIKPVVIKPTTVLINEMFTKCTFPHQLKLARVSSLYKKNDQLFKNNYRHVSILTITSKLFERAMSTQLGDYFSGIFHPFISAFRSGYSCHFTLIALVEDWMRTNM